MFRFTVKETAASGNKTSKEYFFCGYRRPKYPCMMHIYFLSMILVVFNWLVLVFVDNFYFEKTTACNDPSIKDNNYLCFDVTKKFTSSPVNCTKYPNTTVICYIHSYSFSSAISLAYSFFNLVIVSVHVSFIFTLWCVNKCHWGCALKACILFFKFFRILFNCLQSRRLAVHDNKKCNIVRLQSSASNDDFLGICNTYPSHSLFTLHLAYR